MKNFLIILGIIFSLFGFNLSAQATTLKSALEADEPMIILIYAGWSDYKEIYNSMKAIMPAHKEYNFVKVDLNTEDAKYLFERNRFIVSTVPMVVVAKRTGRINKVISNDCAADTSCLTKELKHFTRQ